MQGSIRKKGKSYYIRYYQDGKQIERIGGKTKKEAQSKLNEILYKLENGYTISSDMFISDYLDMWLDDYIKDIRSENTYVKYKNICDKYIIPALGDIKLSALKVIHIEKLIRHFRKEGLNPTSTQNYYGIIRAALNKAVKLQLLNDNPCKFIDTPKRGKFKANTLTVQEFYLIYDKLNAELYEDYIFKLALDIALETGLRRGEMCGLTWDDIDFNNKCIHINQALIRVDNTYTISSLKTDSSYRSLPVSDALLVKLENHKKRQKINRVKYGQFYLKNIFNKKEYDLVFTWENGKFIIPSNFLQRLKRMLKHCNINKNIRWHDLRHTNATLLLEGGASMKTVQERLGHSLMQTTSDTYAHVTEKMNREATNIITNILNVK